MNLQKSRYARLKWVIDKRKYENGRNTDLNNQNVRVWGTLKSQKGPRMNLSMTTINFYVESIEHKDSKN